MTREEAIKILKAIIVYECYPKSASEETKEAIDMAIEALQDKLNGEWIEYYASKERTAKLAVCSECGWYDGCKAKNYNFCPNCGTRMKGGAE